MKERTSDNRGIFSDVCSRKNLLQFTVCIGLDPACNATEPVQRIVMENSDLTVLCQVDIKLNSIVEAGSSLEGSNRIFQE